MNKVALFLTLAARHALHRAIVRVRPPAWRGVLNRVIGGLKGHGPDRGEPDIELLGRLEQDGLLRLGKHFAPAVLDRLSDALKIRMCWDQWRPEIGKFPREEVPSDTNAAHILGVSAIPEAMAMANDPTILALVSAYLGCRPTVENVLAWWSFSGRTAPYQEQYFHRDNNSVRFIKLFVYLTDVEDADGPHTFVRGSHRSGELLHPPGKRFSDREVIALCGPERILRLTGARGTTFLEDTYGLHKGELPRSGERLIFQVTYSTLATPRPFRRMPWQRIVESSPFSRDV